MRFPFLKNRMNSRMILSGILCLASLVPVASAQDTSNQMVTATDLDALKQKIAAQQEEIKKMQQAMDEQQKQLEREMKSLAAKESAKTSPAPATTNDGTNVAAASNDSNNGVRLVPAIDGDRSQSSQPTTPDGANPCESDNVSPTYLRLGNTCVVPLGFMDLTGLWRDKNAGSSIGTNFGSIPLNSAVGAKNSEFRFSPQNSRIGFRIDGDWKGAHFIGYNEFDFLGTSGATNLTVTNGAFVPRLRLFWVDVRKGKVEFLAGQSWSMLTPNRSGISALPGDLFYSQVMDVNYMVGLTWTRQPGVRVLLHQAARSPSAFRLKIPINTWAEPTVAVQWYCRPLSPHSPPLNSTTAALSRAPAPFSRHPPSCPTSLPSSRLTRLRASTSK